MYKNDEEITNEVVFTRLLRTLDCFSDDDVFDMVNDTAYESEELMYPKNASADYIRYCEVENILTHVLAIKEEQFQMIEDYIVYDEENNVKIKDDASLLFEDPAICISSRYESITTIGGTTYGEDIEIWMTNKYDFYTVECSYMENSGLYIKKRRVLFSISEDRKIDTSLFELLYGLQEAHKNEGEV